MTRNDVSGTDADAARHERRQRYLVGSYLLIEGAVPDTFLAEVRAVLEALVEERISVWRDATLLDRDHTARRSDERYHAAWRAAGCPSHETMRFAGQLASPAFGQLASQQWLLDLTSDVLGARETAPLHHSCFGRAKFPHDGCSNIPWHQDAPCLELVEPVDFITAWIPLTDIGVDNPALEIAPVGADQEAFETEWSPSLHYLCMRDADVQGLSDVRTVRMHRGDLLLLSPMLPHRSITNIGPRTRWSVDLRYSPI